MNKDCVPYPHKGLYLLFTAPMLFIYAFIAVHLWVVNLVFFIIYCAFFVFVALFMSYVCVYWECPYIGKFSPCVGGFCLPSSQIARLWKNVKRSEFLYNVTLNMAYFNFFGIILFPIYFLYQLGLLYFLAYLGIVALYTMLFMLFICPVCGTRHICPGGKSAMALRNFINRNKSDSK
jgi:hypothetical protein